MCIQNVWKGLYLYFKKEKIKEWSIYFYFKRQENTVSAHRACTFTHAHVKFLKETLMLALMSLTLVFKAIIPASCF